MKKYKYIALLLCFGVVNLAAVQAQKIEARAIIDSTHVLIGDQFKLRLEIDQSKNSEIGFPQIGDSISSAIEVISRSPLDTFQLSGAEQIKIIQSLTITSFDTGKQVIPAFSFAVKHGNQTDTITSLPVEFFVHGLPIDTTKGPVDIKKPYAAPLSLKEVSPYIMGAILIGALIFFLFYYLRQKKNNKPVFGRPAKPKEPAHIIALKALDHIKEQKLWQKNQTKAYYSEISDTLRIYIQDRYDIPAMEYTTAETLDAFWKNKDLLRDKSFNELKAILGLSDLVKFAKYEPVPDDHNITLMNAYFFVNDTKPEETKLPEASEDDREGEEVNY